jgi:hypothetical protein
MPEQLRDIKGVFYVFDWGTLLFFLFLTLLLAGFGYFLIKRIQRWQPSRKSVQRNAVAPPMPFNEIALEVLMRIDPGEYFEKRKIKEFYIDITDIVRKFLTGNYHIDTLDKTSLEIIEELERVERDFAKVRNLDRYFSECDLVKFAKLRPGLAEMKQKKIESVNIIKEYLRRV